MWTLLPAIALAGGCSLLPGAGSGCDKPKPYQAAQEAPPLRVPDGAVLPDTHNAMRIPQVSAPKLPREGGRCLDQPPSMGTPGPAKG
jgi:uncharacterized lipoprotein